ncbi:J domain-containing protein [Halosegnis marinus]|uniref:J domain-containing protein n=1 Tax=Halosegnis marinus TaxID=3034023 RepID=A0ABD5ZLC1_9EURY|nr:J domain-containing protein [Halosegnis sp. DT85]
MDRSPLVVGLAGVFAGMTVLLVVLAAVFRDVVVLLVAVPFAGATYLFWQHASGRLRERIREQAAAASRAREADDRGGFGAGPRFGDARTRTGRQARAGERTRGGQRIDPNAPSGPSREEAYATLGLDPGADEASVREAYRERVKDTHPDRGGDEERFKEVTAAYERLTD